jgi:predicted porin
VNAVNDALLNAVSTVNSVGAAFDRQAYVGLVTPVGAVLFGRQYTPGYEVSVRFSAFAEGFAGSPAQLSQINIRASNAIQYRIELAGITASAMYGLGGSEANRNERGAPTKGDDFMGANLLYSTPAYGVGVGYNRNNTVTYAAPTESRKGLETWSAGGSASVGPVKLFTSFLKARNQNPVLNPADVLGLVATPGATLATINTTLSGLYINRFDLDGLRGVVGPVDLKVLHLGAQWTLSPAGTLHLGYTRANDTARSPWATADAKVDQFGLAYLHSLSKRTQLYGAGALAKNSGQARAALGGAGYLGGLTTGRGVDNKVVQAGVRHAF